MDCYESSPHFSLIHHSSHISPDLIQESSSLDKAKWHASSCVQFFFLPIKNYRFSEGIRIFFFIMVITTAHIWFCFPQVFGTNNSGISHVLKRCLLLGRKAIINLDSILKSRDVTLPTKVHLVKAMVFPVVMYRCESWTMKKADCRRIDAFELWCWRRHLRVPWTARRSNQSILKKINPEYSLEGLMLKLKLQPLAPWCEELTHWKRPWCWERLKARGEGGGRGWDG